MKWSYVLFFIILLCIILYFIKVKQKEKEKYKIEIYDLNNLYDDSELAPRIIPIRHEFNDLDYIINNKDMNLYLQCRKPFDDKLHKQYGQLVKRVIQKNKIKEPGTYMFRMGSTPHRILTHFDIGDRYIYIVRGQKDILTFRIDDYSPDEQVELLHRVKELKMNQIMDYLTKNNITYRRNILKQGDLFHINPGDYHYVENNTIGDYTIAINFDYDNENAKELVYLFKYMWKNGLDWYTVNEGPMGEEKS